MSRYPKTFWLLSGLSVFIAGAILFIPFSLVEGTIGISFRAFFIAACIIEFICAGFVIYMFMKYRVPEEERESEWTYDP